MTAVINFVRKQTEKTESRIMWIKRLRIAQNNKKLNKQHIQLYCSRLNINN